MQASCRGLEVSELGPAQISGPESFARAPMTTDRLVQLPGISGYRLPSLASPWLELRLDDGAWLRVRPVDEDLDYYQLEPQGREAARQGIRERFLPRWSAFKHVARLAMAALERVLEQADSHSSAPQETSEDETGPYCSVQRVDFRPIACQRLGRYARQGGITAAAEVSLSAGFR